MSWRPAAGGQGDGRQVLALLIDGAPPAAPAARRWAGRRTGRPSAAAAGSSDRRRWDRSSRPAPPAPPDLPARAPGRSARRASGSRPCFRRGHRHKCYPDAVPRAGPHRGQGLVPVVRHACPSAATPTRPTAGADLRARPRRRHQLLRHRRRLQRGPLRGDPRAAARAAAATRSCSPPRRTFPTGKGAERPRAARATTWCARSRPACAGSAPIGSTSTTCTASTTQTDLERDPARARRSGRARARSSTRRARTSPPGRWRTRWGWRPQRQLAPLVALQPMYNLLKRQAEVGDPADGPGARRRRRALQPDRGGPPHRQVPRRRAARRRARWRPTRCTRPATATPATGTPPTRFTALAAELGHAARGARRGLGREPPGGHLGAARRPLGRAARGHAGRRRPRARPTRSARASPRSPPSPRPPPTAARRRRAGLSLALDCRARSYNPAFPPGKADSMSARRSRIDVENSLVRAFDENRGPQPTTKILRTPEPAGVRDQVRPPEPGQSGGRCRKTTPTS